MIGMMHLPCWGLEMSYINYICVPTFMTFWRPLPGFPESMVS